MAAVFVAGYLEEDCWLGFEDDDAEVFAMLVICSEVFSWDVIGTGSTNLPDSNTLQTILDPNAPPLPVKTITSTSLINATTAGATKKSHNNHSVATIVIAQRNCLRVRCDALEAERDSFKREFQVQVQTAESFKMDNTKRYENIQYLQSFNGCG